MSVGGKFVVRPKVRFCQWEDENKSEEDEINKKEPFASKKPTIRNIINVENPYRIVSLDNITSKSSFEQGKREFSDKKWPENGSNEENLNLQYQDNSDLNQDHHDFDQFQYEFASNQAPSVDSSFSSKDEISQNPKIVEVDVHAEDIPDTQEDVFPEEARAFVNSKEHLFQGDELTENVQSVMTKNLSSIEEEIETPRSKTPEPLKIPDAFLVTKTSEPKSPRKNFKCLTKRQLNSVNRLSKAKSPKKIVPEKLSAKIRPRPLGFIQRSSMKPKVAGVMPCMKAKVAAKGKQSPVKKTVLRNVTVKPTKVSVEPGVPRSKKELKMDLEDERKSQPFTSEKLSKPEYNSIMCTINKLKEVQKENIITDVEHLPPIYKSLVNGKVTNSLDFPPDEVIFKNLINLSIDETQLPTRMTRSKDPEPRQRDAVPKLSDFFLPKYANEYCTAVCAKPRSPEPLENWSAFKVSDKIRSWKWNMDFVH